MMVMTILQFCRRHAREGAAAQEQSGSQASSIVDVGHETYCKAAGQVERPRGKVQAAGEVPVEVQERPVVQPAHAHSAKLHITARSASA